MSPTWPGLRRTAPIGGVTRPFRKPILFHGCRTPLESARPSARVLRGVPSSSCRVFVRATYSNATRCPGPRVPHVRGCCARALLRGVSRKGRDAWVAALAKASTYAAHGARPRRSTALRHERQLGMERGGRASTYGSRFRFGGSQAVDETRSTDDAGLPPTSATLSFRSLGRVTRASARRRDRDG